MKRPRWIAGVAIAVIGAVVFTSFGFWQLRRLDARKADNAQILARSHGEPVPIGEVASDMDEARYQLVSVAGDYLVDRELILQARSLGGLSGHHVITPLRYADGRIVLVERGWVPIDVEGPPAVGFEPAATTVEITGIVLATQQPSNFGPADPPEGTLERIGRIDIDRLQDQFNDRLDPFYVRLVEQVPPQGDDGPKLVPIPETDEGPHFAYAVQWFLFAGVVAVGFPVLIRRTATKPAPKRRPDASRR